MFGARSIPILSQLEALGVWSQRDGHDAAVRPVAAELLGFPLVATQRYHLKWLDSPGYVRLASSSFRVR
jgi:hypothetical protein